MNDFKFSIPWIDNLSYLRKIISEKESKIYEVFYRPNDLFLTGVDKSRKILRFLKDNNISLALTTTQRSGILDFNKTFKEYLELFEIVPNKLIVDQFSIKIIANNKLVRKHNIQLYCSAIMGVKTDKDVQKLIQLKKQYPAINNICLHHDSTRDIELKNKVSFLKKSGIDAMLLVTESCSNNCQFRKDHYSYLATKFDNQKDPYQMWCVKNRLKQTNILKEMSGFVHPKNIQNYYKSFGVKYFKITGQPSSDRKRTTKENIKTIDAYLLGKIPYNIFKIIVFTYLKHPVFNFLRLQGNDDKNIRKYPFFTKEENKLYNLFKRTVVINNIYRKYKYKLPWTNIQIPNKVKECLKNISRSEKLLVVGCGLGQHLQYLKEMGFKDVWATDISSVAIVKIRKKYPWVKSFTCPTEDLHKNELKNFVVLDLHNLHQIKPNEINNYLSSLRKISKSLILSWIVNNNESQNKFVTKSDILELGNIFMHDPKLIKKRLKMKDVESFDYEIKNNSEYMNNKNYTYKFVGEIFNNE